MIRDKEEDQMNRVTINGKTYETETGNISVTGNRVIVDGKDVSGEEYSGVLEIKFEGGLANLSVDNGNVECQDIKGNVRAGGSIHAKSITGPVMSGGSLHAETINGDAKAGGSITAGNVSGQPSAQGSLRIEHININA